ncbi:LysR substrate-binding domain-containing protein, partial [Vibrio genomosp. F10]
EFHSTHADVAIYFAADDSPNVHKQRLFGEMYIPVCTPEYAKQHHIYEDGLESLKRINFIHASDSNAWQRWINENHLDIDVFERFYSVSQRIMTIEAARSHLGVAMGRYHFVKDRIDSGEFVTPYPSMNTHLGYDLLCPLGSENRPKIRTFINWIEGYLN